MAGDDGKDDRKWVLRTVVALLLTVTIPTATLVFLMDSLNANSARLAAILTFVGVLVTACVSLAGLLISRQSARRLRQEHEDERSRLRLDAAMRAGSLFSATDSGPADPAAVASGLLALTKLDHADLAVALLVDLWAGGNNKVSNETAVLVIDAALRSQDQLNAQLVAAELLCRNATRLDSCQSLHWPSVIDGSWNPNFGPRTKLLLLDALVSMALAGPANPSALRFIAVRLHGISAEENDDRVRGCIGILNEGPLM